MSQKKLSDSMGVQASSWYQHLHAFATSQAQDEKGTLKPGTKTTIQSANSFLGYSAFVLASSFLDVYSQSPDHTWRKLTSSLVFNSIAKLNSSQFFSRVSPFSGKPQKKTPFKDLRTFVPKNVVLQFIKDPDSYRAELDLRLWDMSYDELEIHLKRISTTIKRSQVGDQQSRQTALHIIHKKNLRRRYKFRTLAFEIRTLQCSETIFLRGKRY